MSSLDDRPFPNYAIIGAGLLMLTTVVGVGAVQLSKRYATPMQSTTETVEEVRRLRFVDAGDGVNAFGGHVRVYDAQTGREYAELRENDGFVRAALNGLAFERTRRGIAATSDFELVRWSSKRITLGDSETGKRISVGAFGADNKAVFLRFFNPPELRS